MHEKIAKIQNTVKKEEKELASLKKADIKQDKKLEKSKKKRK